LFFLIHFSSSFYLIKRTLDIIPGYGSLFPFLNPNPFKKQNKLLTKYENPWQFKLRAQNLQQSAKVAFAR
jgi:hypothetical protein